MTAATTISGIGAEPSAHSILNIAEIVTDQRGNGLTGTPFEGLSFSGDRRWGSGVRFRPTASGCAHMWPRDADCDVPDDSCTSLSWPVVDGQVIRPDEQNLARMAGKHDSCDECVTTFMPMTIYYPEGCNDNTPTGEDYFARAREGLSVYEATMIARELATGWATGNPSLWSASRPITQSSPLNAKRLMSAFAAQAEKHCAPGGLKVHSPSWTAGEWASRELITFEDGRWITPYMGIEMHFGPGLTGTDEMVGPDFDPNLIDPWAFMTSNVYVALSPIQRTEDDGAGNPGVGEWVAAERQVLVMFNPSIVWRGQLDNNA